MAYQTAWGGNDHIGSALHAALFLLVSDAVVAAIYSHAAHVGQVIGKALHSLVNLLCKLSCRRHDDAVDGIGGVSSVLQFAQDGQQIGGSLAGTSLCDTQHIASLQDGRDRVLLDGSGLDEVHVVQCIKHQVV